MQNITVSTILKEKVPHIHLSCIECDVQPEEINNELWNEIQNKINELSSELKVENISRIPAISASRRAYKACGKDPARYRLSAEALLRRVVKHNEIYQISNVVDLLNLVSISTGFSIGGYDAEKINGDIIFGIGENIEAYQGIGRGALNIENLPVFRDETGAFGTPTSDSVRTLVNLQTKRFLMIIVGFGEDLHINEATNFAVRLLKKYANAANFQFKIVD